MTVYFDNAATTMVCREAADAAYKVMTECYGNPSSGHGLGRNAAAILRDSREAVASALGADASEIYFTSGGTEGDNWALLSGAHFMRHKGKHIISTSVEHDAVRKTLQRLQNDGWEVTWLDPDKTGAITAAQVSDALREDTVLVSVMLVNNETGAINPISDISKVIKSSKSHALLHTDAVQGFLKIPFTPKKLGADLVTISSHKIHGPKGVGALYIRSGLRLSPMITGGAQEGALRPGTEGLPAIAGFAEAAKIGKAGFSENTKIMSELRDYLLTTLQKEIPGVLVIGGGAPHILSISLPGYRSEVLMNVLDAAGICVSKSSACKKGARSHVLEAMKLSNSVIDGAIRISLSRYNTIEEADYFVETLKAAAGRLRTSK